MAPMRTPVKYSFSPRYARYLIWGALGLLDQGLFEGSDIEWMCTIRERRETSGGSPGVIYKRLELRLSGHHPAKLPPVTTGSAQKSKSYVNLIFP